MKQNSASSLSPKSSKAWSSIFFVNARIWEHHPARYRLPGWTLLPCIQEFCARLASPRRATASTPGSIGRSRICNADGGEPGGGLPLCGGTVVQPRVRTRRNYHGDGVSVDRSEDGARVPDLFGRDASDGRERGAGCGAGENYS